MKEAFVEATMDIVKFEAIDIISTSEMAGDPAVTYTYPEGDWGNAWDDL